jgi:hypothetical protein
MGFWTGDAKKLPTPNQKKFIDRTHQRENDGSGAGDQPIGE